MLKDLIFSVHVLTAAKHSAKCWVNKWADCEPSRTESPSFFFCNALNEELHSPSTVERWHLQRDPRWEHPVPLRCCYDLVFFYSLFSACLHLFFNTRRCLDVEWNPVVTWRWLTPEPVLQCPAPAARYYVRTIIVTRRAAAAVRKTCSLHAALPIVSRCLGFGGRSVRLKTISGSCSSTQTGFQIFSSWHIVARVKTAKSLLKCLLYSRSESSSHCSFRPHVQIDKTTNTEALQAAQTNGNCCSVATRCDLARQMFLAKIKKCQGRANQRQNRSRIQVGRKLKQGEGVYSEQWAFEATRVCLQDNRFSVQ